MTTTLQRTLFIFISISFLCSCNVKESLADFSQATKDFGESLKINKSGSANAASASTTVNKAPSKSKNSSTGQSNITSKKLVANNSDTSTVYNIRAGDVWKGTYDCNGPKYDVTLISAMRPNTSGGLNMVFHYVISKEVEGAFFLGFKQADINKNLLLQGTSGLWIVKPKGHHPIYISTLKLSNNNQHLAGEMLDGGRPCGRINADMVERGTPKYDKSFEFSPSIKEIKNIMVAEKSTDIPVQSIDLSDDLRSFQVRDIKLGQSYNEIMRIYPNKRLGKNKHGRYTLSILSGGENKDVLEATFIGRPPKLGPVTEIFLTQNLGVSEIGCQQRADKVGTQLIKKYGSPIDHDNRTRIHTTKWIPEVTKQEYQSSAGNMYSHSLLTAKLTCTYDEVLHLRLMASGSYVTKYMGYINSEHDRIREEKRKQELLKNNKEQELKI